MKEITGGVTAAKGFQAASTAAGIKYKDRKDMAMIYSEVPCKAAGTFTTNIVKAAPVKWDHNVVYNSKAAQAVVINAGIANACTGEEGMGYCRQTAEKVEKVLGIAADEVLVASTGVIGMQLPIDRICNGIDAMVPLLKGDTGSGTEASKAIMTTDTKNKEVAVTIEIGGKTVTIGGMCKGSGMIHPNMCTMLSFVTTDAAISKELLQEALSADVQDTYNMISVDGDTSTNDTLIIMASGLAGNPEICEENEDYHAFVAALTAIAEHMCAEHAGDGEGATHLITCEVTHAPDLKTARAVSRSVVCSNLFKAAVFGRDANWGRILCAIGYTPGDFSIDKVCVWLSSAAGEVYVCENAAYHPYSEDEAAKVLAEHDILVKVDMGTGDASAKAWGCDLTYDYVKINGDYRT